MEVEMETPLAKPEKSPCPRYGLCDSACGCCCCCCCLTMLLMVLIMTVYVASAIVNVEPATKFSNIEYKGSDGTTLYAYLATPQMPAGEKAPAAVVFHAWNGLSEEAVYFSDKLAEAGYWAIAPDLFRNVATEEMNIIRNIYNVMTAPQERVDADSDAALAYLETLDGVNTSHIVSGPGFCFGGAQSLIFSTRHATAATVTCYGTYIRELADASSSNWGLIGVSPVLGIYGALDTSPSPAEAEAFKAALTERGNPHNVSIYAGVGHAFINPHAHRDATDPGNEQAVTAWSEILTFLEVHSDSSSAPAALSAGGQHGHYGGHGGNAAHVHEATNSLSWRVLCALKCALDLLRGTGHAHHARMPTFGLEKLLAIV